MLLLSYCLRFYFVFKQKTAYEMRISDWSADVCSSDLDAGDENAFVGLVDNAKIGGLRLRIRVGTVGLRVNEVQRAVQIFFTHPLQEVEDVLLKATAVSTDRLAFPHCGIVGVGGEGVVMTVRKTTISGAVHFAQDRLGVATLDAKTFLSGVIFPLARPDRKSTRLNSSH